MGSGAYNFKPMLASLKNELKPMMKKALMTGGGALGSYTGIGKGIGTEVGRRISRLIGSGDYTMNEVSVNSLIKGAGNVNATFGTDGTSVRIRHREFLGDIVTGSFAGQFNNNVFPVNPGIKTSFPYLSQIADNFELYCFHGLVFEFISTASPYLATSGLGSVIAGAEYNASVPAFTSKFAMENSNAAVSTRIDKNIMYGLECASGGNAQNCYYVRNGASSLPLTTTDLGNFQFATAPGTGFPANSVIGELWVTYDVSLTRPILVLSRFGAFQAYRSGVTNPLPLGATDLGTTRSGCLSGASVSSTVITIPNCITGDCFYITTKYAGVAAGYIDCTYTYSQCAVLSGGYPAYVTNVQAPQTGAGAITSAIQSQAIQATTSGTITVTMGATGLPATSTVSIVMVSVGNYPLGTASF